VSQDFFLVRLDRGGALDQAFGDNGTADTSFSRGAVATSVIELTDGSVVAGGWLEFPYEFALAKYLRNGALDTTFGSGGLVDTPFASDPTEYSSGVVRALALQGNKIVAAGTAALQNGEIALARYTSSGELDTTFGSSGLVDTNVHNSFAAFDLAVQPDGALIVVGQGSDLRTYRFDVLAVTRYLVDGVLDAAFGVAGTMFLDIETPFNPNDPPENLVGPDEQAQALIMQDEGRLVVVGTASCSYLDQFNQYVSDFGAVVVARIFNHIP
jgi:uncharacterized delta-60 repeat protein